MIRWSEMWIFPTRKRSVKIESGKKIKSQELKEEKIFRDLPDLASWNSRTRIRNLFFPSRQIWLFEDIFVQPHHHPWQQQPPLSSFCFVWSFSNYRFWFFFFRVGVRNLYNPTTLRLQLTWFRKIKGCDFPKPIGSRPFGPRLRYLSNLKTAKAPQMTFLQSQRMPCCPPFLC